MTKNEQSEARLNKLNDIAARGLWLEFMKESKK